MKKKLLSLFLIFVLVFSILPNTLALDEPEDTDVVMDPVVSTEENDTPAEPPVETETGDDDIAPSEGADSEPEEEPAEEPIPAEEDQPAEPVLAENEQSTEPAPSGIENLSDPALENDPVPEVEPEPVSVGPKPAKPIDADVTITSENGIVSIKGLLPDDTTVSASPVVFPNFRRTRKAASTTADGGGLDLSKKESADFAAVFDIKLLDADGTTIQPEKAVTVTIDDVAIEGPEANVYHILESADAIRKGLTNGSVQAVTVGALYNYANYDAFAATKEVTGEEQTIYVEVLRGTVKNGSVTFEATNFSIYLIEEGSTIVTPRRIYHFENRNGEPYEFYNTAGNIVTYQIIKSGDALEDVGTPTDLHGDETFAGWFIYTKISETEGEFGEKVNFGESITVTETAEMTEYYVRPYYGHVYYVDYYETTYNTEEKPGIILTKKQYVAGSTINLNAQTVDAPDAELAFVGWSYEQFIPTPYPDNPNKYDYSADTRTPLTDVQASFAINHDVKVYPIFKQAHWVHFISAPVGSGATYVAPKFVLGTQTTSVARPGEDVEMIWTGYTFRYWTKTPTIQGNALVDFGNNPPEEYGFNEYLTKDLDLYAYWEKATTDYTVQFYRQLATDEVDQSPKNYEYIGSVTRQAVVGTTVNVTDSDKNGTTNLLNADNSTSPVLDVPAGFSFNESNSSVSAIVNANGSTVLKVYFDRNVFTLAFTVEGSNYQDYVLATDDNGRQYALVNGEYVELTREENTQTTWYWSTSNNNSGSEYTGTVYTRQGNNYSPYGGTAEEASNNTKYYGYYRSGYSLFADYHRVYRRSRSTTSYTWKLNGEEFTGTRYKIEYTRYHIVKTIVALYEHSIKDEFPIIGYDNTSYDGWSWSDDTKEVYPFVLKTIEAMPAANVVLRGYSRPKTNIIYYYLEVVNGEELEGLVTRRFGNKTYKLYKDVYHSFNYLTYDEEYHPIEGYERAYSLAEPSFYYSQQRGGYTADIPSSGINYLYYNRSKHDLEFRDSNTNAKLTSFATQSLQYEEPYTNYQPSSIPISPLQGYVFKGWFKDIGCTEEFEWDDIMPNHNVVVYAGWEQIWYRIEVDPNGGELHGSESTFFWLSYGNLVEEYGDINRDYVQDDSGTYMYHYHPYSALIEFLPENSEYSQPYQHPLYYSYWGRVANYDELTTTVHYHYDPNKLNDDGTTGGYVADTTPVEDTVNFNGSVKYRYEKGAYALVGWYEVNEDGTLGSVYDFGTQVTRDIKIRAIWRRVGEYHVRYDAGDGTDAPSDSNTYADKSESAVLSAPKPPEGMVFAGWLYKGVLYQSGQVYQIDADVAEVINGRKTVTLTAVYQTAEQQPVKVTSITLDGNGGTFAVGNDDFSGTVGATSVGLEDLDLNTKVTLLGECSFVRPGYELRGWSFTQNSMTVDFAFNAIVGMDNIDRSATTSGNDATNTLYAVWEQINVRIDYVPIGGGTVSRSTETIPSATGMPQGSMATALDGYTFIGWYSDEECENRLSTEAAFTPSKNSDNVYEAATYYAKFEENKVTLYYEVVGPAGCGTVDPASETVAIWTGEAQGSIAASSDERVFDFAGWFSDAECTTKINENLEYVPTKESDAAWADGTTYYAKFVEKTVTVNYVAVGPDGTTASASTYWVNPEKEEDIFILTGKLTGSTAGSTNVYKFVGWYSDEDCTEEHRLSTDAHYTPTKATGEIWVDGTTYYAKFEYNLTKLKITKTGMESGENAVFTVTGKGIENGITVVVKNGETVTIDGVYVGEIYTITEIGGWTWKYTANATSVSKTIEAPPAENLVTFTNTLNNNHWLSGENRKTNVFKKATTTPAAG